MDGPVHLIFNPAARSGAAAHRRAALEAALAAHGLEFVLEPTGGPGHAARLAEAAAARGARAVVAVGGDGTVHEVANGLLRVAEHGAEIPPLAVVPAGTGNDFAKLLGGVDGPAAACQAILAGRVRRYDVGWARWGGGSEYFVNVLGTGIDAEVARGIERAPRLPGTLRYLAGLTAALARYRPRRIRVAWDGGSREQEVMLVAVGNGVCQGGGFHLFPDARPDDGRLDLCIIDRLGALEIPGVVARVLRGTHAGCPKVVTERTEWVEIQAADGSPFLFQMDGEPRRADPPAPLRVGLRTAALPVIVGPGYGGPPPDRSG